MQDERRAVCQPAKSSPTATLRAFDEKAISEERVGGGSHLPESRKEHTVRCASSQWQLLTTSGRLQVKPDPIGFREKHTCWSS